jgi:exo-beta-1,3-glucanase (GH17 family)
LRLEPLEDRRMLSGCSFDGPVLAALTTCRNWVAYTPSQREDGYNPNVGNDVSLSHLQADLQQLHDAGFRRLVTYTLDGNLGEAPRIAKQIGFEQVIAGVFWFDNAQLLREKTAVVEQWPYYDALIVGNEGLSDGRYTRQELEEEVKSLRRLTGKPVATTEVGGQYLADPTLLEVGDFTMVNIQPWFNAANDPNDPAAMAAAVAGEYQALLAARDEAFVVIKEAWWPTDGHAAATEANQSAFFAALVDSGVPFVWGEAYDQPWKTGEGSPFGTFGPTWGLFDSGGAAKQVMADRAVDIDDTYYPLDDFLTSAMTVVRTMRSSTVTGGLPINEASDADLDELARGVLDTPQAFFNPAQLGFWFTAAVGSHALRDVDADFTAGYDDAELLVELDATLDKLETIFTLPDNVYSDAQTGGKALYQVYLTPSGERVDDPQDTFANTVPLIDNTYLIVGLQVALEYLLQLDTQSLDPGVDAAHVEMLADRLTALLSEFDLSMWMLDGSLHIGAEGAADPRTGPTFDRITTETRVAPVLANSRGELTDQQLAELIDQALGATLVGAADSGSQVERTAASGAALETGVAATFLPHELTTLFGSGTLLTYPRAWSETAGGLGLPAYGPLAAATSANGFLRFGLSPAQTPTPHTDAAVVSPLGAALVAASIATPRYGPLQRATAEAWNNLTAAIQAAMDRGQLHALYGTPNVVDFGSTLVGEPPLWGFLEVAQSLTSMLNARLGGSFYFDLLKRDSAFEEAVFRYEQLLNRGEFEYDRDDSDPGVQACRDAASGGTLDGVYDFGCLTGASWHIETPGDFLGRDFYARARGDYELTVAYSNENDDTKPGDVVEVLVDGEVVDQFIAADTNDWNSFTQTAPIVLQDLSPGRHEIGFRLASTDGFGIDLDWLKLELTAADWRNPVDHNDVNGDGDVTPLDVLLVIVYINSHPNDNDLPSLPALPGFYYDTDGSGFVSPLDVLLVINQLNAESANAEGEPADEYFRTLGASQT